MKRILFVDDEPNVLEGMRRMLYPLRSAWSMTFVSSGRDALKTLSESPYDVLVTDLRMPGMSGIELLGEVVKRHPEVIRMALSGTTDQDITLQSVMLAHQYLVKPCDAATLRATVERAFSLRDMLSSPALKRVITHIHSLPSIPVAYVRLNQLLQSPEVSPADVATVVSSDIGMTAKLLQLVNSAFFGLSRRITNPKDAVTYLGISTVRSLVLTASVFSQFKPLTGTGFSIEDLHEHSLAVGMLARRISQSAGAPRAVSENALVGGLLHDVGKLILAHNFRKPYDEAMQRVKKQRISTCAAEMAVFGTTHAEVGAYLLWLWGLPDSLTEVVARHHNPPQGQGTPASALAAVHLADALVHEPADCALDQNWVSKLGLSGDLSQWRQLREELAPC